MAGDKNFIDALRRVAGPGTLTDAEMRRARKRRKRKKGRLELLGPGALTEVEQKRLRKKEK